MNEQNKASLQLPEKYALRCVRPTAVTPEIDGIITEAEWGSTPEFCLNAGITEGKRTYCRDYFFGDGKSIPDMKFYWRYDDRYVYVAAQIADPSYDKPDATVQAQCALVIQMGGCYCRVVPENGKISHLQGNMCAGYAESAEGRSFEFAAPRDQLMAADADSFLGSIEYTVTVKFSRPGDSVARSIEIVSRTTPIFSEKEFVNDVFRLEPGTPAAAPSLEIPVSRAAKEPLEMHLAEGYTIRVSEPTVLVQGRPEDRIWGHYQFPGLHRNTDGSICASWCYNRDDIGYASDENPDGATHSTSYDNGKTWVLGGKQEGCSAKVPMHNGKYFMGFTSKGAYKTDYLDKYTPAFAADGFRMFFAEEIAETVDTVVTATECDPATGKTETFECKINWPYMPLTQHPGKMVYPVTMAFSLSGRSVLSLDGDLYYPMYCRGFNSFAASREEAADEFSRYAGVYFFKSTDNGRTWDLLAQFRVDNTVEGYAEGFDEPEMDVMADGSFVMLMRTGSDNPSYYVRSTDKGVTWTKPMKFDTIGVVPQIQALPCGVTIATYGRPEMRIRATADRSGLQWADPVTVPMSAAPGSGPFQTSCFYTDTLAVDDNTALFIYTDFMYPNENGVPVKTVLVRTVTVVPD